MKKKNINVNAFDEKDLKKISFNNLETHLNSNIDIIYIMRLKRISKFSQKIQLNKK